MSEADSVIELRGLDQALHNQANKEANAILNDALSNYRQGRNGLKETLCQLGLFKVQSVEVHLCNDQVMTEKEMQLMEQVDDIFSKYDIDDDETLSIEEIMPFIIQELGLPYENLETMFNEIDKNNDNQICKEELYDFLLENRDMVEVPETKRSISMPETLKMKAEKSLKKFQNLEQCDLSLLQKASKLEYRNIRDMQIKVEID